MKGLKVIEKKILDSQDSFFYDGQIATVTKPNGTILWLEACGEVRVNYKDQSYRDLRRFDLIRELELNDKKLHRWTKLGKITWSNNNWFEVVWQKPGDSFVDSALGDVAYTYDEAIDLLSSYYDDPEY